MRQMDDQDDNIITPPFSASSVINNDHDNCLFFATNVNIEQIPESEESPTVFRIQYTVTGATRKVRNRRTTSLAYGPITVNATDILLFKIHNQVVATTKLCPHQGTSLVMADIEDSSIVCSAHQWKFKLSTGVCALHPQNKKLETYPVQVEDDGMIFVGFQKLSGELFVAPDF